VFRAATPQALKDWFRPPAGGRILAPRCKSAPPLERSNSGAVRNTGRAAIIEKQYLNK